MPSVHVVSACPLGIGTLDGSNGINIVDVSGGPRSDFLEVLAGKGQFILSAVKALRPVEEWSIQYELLDGAALSLAFGVAVNTNYLITSFNAACGPDAYPTVNLTCVKPSSAAKIKPYAFNAITLALAGGMGIVEKFGATAAEAFVSSSCNVSMRELEAMGETDGDYLAAGLYRYGFKKEVSVEAYGAITEPVNAKVTTSDQRESREGWKTFAKSFWLYMDAI